MINEVQNLLNNYVSWLRDKTKLRQINQEWVEITTPYLDRHNDYLQIYAKHSDGGFTLTDGGYILEDLEQNGCVLESQKRKNLLNTTLNGFGVKKNENNLEISASSSNFHMQKHNLIQAMLSVNDMFYLADSTIEDLFFEDVMKWFDENDIRYTHDIRLTGKSGYSHSFDFIIPKSRNQPERIVQAINKADKAKAQSFVFAWIDSRESRAAESKSYAFLNNIKGKRDSIYEALKNYEIIPILWDEREKIREELAA